MSEHLKTGEEGETLAKNFLLENGYELLEKNWRFRKAEVDLIFEKHPFVVFVEVKTRYDNDNKEALAAIGNAKQRLLLSAADAYMQDYQGDMLEARFDVVTLTRKDKQWNIEHFENAFSPQF